MKENQVNSSERSDFEDFSQVVSQMAEALENILMWAEDHIALSKSSGEMPAIDTYRVNKVRKALDTFYKTIQ